MERESNTMQAPCRSGCGFYGSPATDGLCSICYKPQWQTDVLSNTQEMVVPITNVEALKKKQQLPSTPTPLSALRDTTTAHPTISRLPSSNVTDLPIESMSERHLPSSTSSTSNKSEEQVPPGSPLDSGSKHSVASADRTSVDGGGAQKCGSAPVLIYQSQSSTAASIILQASEECTAPAQAQASSTDEVAIAAAAAAQPDAGSEEKDSDKDAKKKKNRCATCRKKVGLTGFECRCGGLYCSLHRYSDKHDCSFNYREMGAQEIRRNNPVVVGEKIQKI